MIKKIRIALALSLTFACGSPEEGGTELGGQVLGTAEQAVYMPVLYGFEGGNGGPACGTPGAWADNECFVPNSKRHYVKFHAGTCTSWWQARAVEIWNEVLADLNYVNSYVRDDRPNWELLPADGTGLSNGVIFQWGCDGNTSPEGAGSFVPNKSNSDDIDVAGNDELRQYKGGVLKLYTTYAQNDGRWTTSNDARRQRRARNLIRHEVWHQFGLGHETPGLMGDCDYWNTECWPSFDQYQRVACYNPSNGGLFDDC